jgi:hypothetical protein
MIKVTRFHSPVWEDNRRKVRLCARFIISYAAWRASGGLFFGGGTLKIFARLKLFIGRRRRRGTRGLRHKK